MSWAWWTSKTIYNLYMQTKDRGCTVPGYGCQAHYTNGWAQGGHTNITHLSAACKPHNLLI
jgi:GH35 family endo-1,4-beta-xylanase